MKRVPNHFLILFKPELGLIFWLGANQLGAWLAGQTTYLPKTYATRIFLALKTAQQLTNFSI